MGGRNRTCLNQEWTGVDGNQIVRKNGSCDGLVLDGLSWLHRCGSAAESCQCGANPGYRSSAGPGDLTPRRGLVYDADRVELYYALSEGGMRRGR